MPITCDSHDELEALSVKRAICRIFVSPPQGGPNFEVSGRIMDIYIRDGRECLRLDSGQELPLENIRKVYAEGRSIDIVRQ